MPVRNKKYSEAPAREKAAKLAEWLAEKKGRDIVAFDVSKTNTLLDAIVIASASSARHGQGLAEHVLNEAGKESYEFLRMEGHAVGQWILLDFNDVVVHIFQPDSRQLFRLDDLWPADGVFVDMREDV